jgi:hypothetical protein
VMQDAELESFETALREWAGEAMDYLSSQANASLLA